MTMGSPAVHEAILDDAPALGTADRGGRLLQAASAGAQVRSTLAAAEEAGVRRLADEGRPRAVVVAGVGGSAVAGQVLAAVAGSNCPVPVVCLTGPVLPGWVGTLDLVVAVSWSGAAEQTLSVFDEAARRGARLLTIGAASSPLARRAEQARAVHVPVTARGGASQAQLWAVSVPLLLAAHGLGLASSPPELLAATADRLDELADQCSPHRPTFDNPAKALALELSGALPLVWGSGPAGAAAASRFTAQLWRHAKVPALCGDVPALTHDQLAVLDGPYGTVADAGIQDDFFRDRLEEIASVRLRVVLLRDAEEHPRAAAAAAALPALAEQRGLGVSELRATGTSVVERLAHLTAIGDFASVYCALLAGMDPSPSPAISELKERLSR